MRVDDPNDRQEMPEECDGCGHPAELTRFSHYGPGYQVDWLCPYCAVCPWPGLDNSPAAGISKRIASMFNVLEERLKNERK
ncbi:MAG: hypothetical protein ACXQT0_04810 [Candidatus Methanofastidiosia archaeon]